MPILTLSKPPFYNSTVCRVRENIFWFALFLINAGLVWRTKHWLLEREKQEQMNHSPPVGLEAGCWCRRKTIRMLIGVDWLREFARSTESDREEPAAPCCWCFRVKLKTKNAVINLFINPLRTVHLHPQKCGSISISFRACAACVIVWLFLAKHQPGSKVKPDGCPLWNVPLSRCLFVQPPKKTTLQRIPHDCVWVAPSSIFNLPLCLESNADCLPYSQAEFGRALLRHCYWSAVGHQWLWASWRLVAVWRADAGKDIRSLTHRRAWGGCLLSRGSAVAATLSFLPDTVNLPRVWMCIRRPFVSGCTN